MTLNKKTSREKSLELDQLRLSDEKTNDKEIIDLYSEKM